MKLKEVLIESFQDQVETALFTAWKQDALFPTGAHSPLDLDEEDFDDFLHQVDQIMVFARKYHITNAREAIDAHVESIRNNYKQPTIH